MRCCYLLRSTSSRKRSYIGWSVDSLNRLLQHNGILSGGAKATQLHRPWEIVAVVSGFASDTAARCFEYAWQNPCQPWWRMLKYLRPKGLIVACHAYEALRKLTKSLVKNSDTVVWRLRVLAVMLGMSQWEGLTVQFAATDDKAFARVHFTSPYPLAIKRSLVQAFPSIAAALPEAPEVAGRVRGKKRPRCLIDEDVIVVEDDVILVD